MDSTTLSIIIPNYNSGEYSKDCIASLRKEKTEGVEYLLIDGGSDDISIDLFRDSQRLFTVLLSEKDSGQSEAINKGFGLAKGRYLTWLNADDRLHPGSLKKLIKFLNTTEENWITCNSVYIDANSRCIKCCRSGGFERFAVNGGILNVFGPSSIIKNEVFRHAGGLRTDFHFCMDTEYWWRLVKFGYAYIRFPQYLWELRLHENAKTANVILNKKIDRKMQSERKLIQEMYFSNVSERDVKETVRKVKLWRILNGSYPKAFLDTALMKTIFQRDFRECNSE
jgi:GT2 family glycosyltransferase